MSTYPSFLAGIARDRGLPPLTPDAVAELVFYGGRLAESQTKVTAQLGLIAEVAIEAGYRAQQRGHHSIDGAEVVEALAAARRRGSHFRDQVHELLADGTIRIDVTGERVGQVNAISVLCDGPQTFGRPCRVTAVVYPGVEGPVNIAREVEMSGPAPQQGRARDRPASSRCASGRAKPPMFGASLVFEQTYEAIDGDSASSSELYALLSALSGCPLRQELAVTGSVDQQGGIQPVGGLNEKIEAFYDLCAAKGLTGRQGVIIPESNRDALMLRGDVVEAIAEGRFHVHAVTTVEEGIELLTGVPAGVADENGHFPEGTLFRARRDAAQALPRGDERAVPRRAEVAPRRAPTRRCGRPGTSRRSARGSRGSVWQARHCARVRLGLDVRVVARGAVRRVLRDGVQALRWPCPCGTTVHVGTANRCGLWQFLHSECIGPALLHALDLVGVALRRSAPTTRRPCPGGAVCGAWHCVHWCLPPIALAASSAWQLGARLLRRARRAAGGSRCTAFACGERGGPLRVATRALSCVAAGARAGAVLAGLCGWWHERHIACVSFGRIELRLRRPRGTRSTPSSARRASRASVWQLLQSPWCGTVRSMARRATRPGTSGRGTSRRRGCDVGDAEDVLLVARDAHAVLRRARPSRRARAVSAWHFAQTFGGGSGLSCGWWQPKQLSFAWPSGPSRTTW